MNRRHTVMWIPPLLLSASFLAVLAWGAQSERKGTKFDIALFYKTSSLRGSEPAEFVVKLSNRTSSGVRVYYDRYLTRVVQVDSDHVDAKDGWLLELVVDMKSARGIVDTSGLLDGKNLVVPAADDYLVLFEPPQNRLPGKKLKIWAELRNSSTGEVVRSNVVELERDGSH